MEEKSVRFILQSPFYCSFLCVPPHEKTACSKSGVSHTGWEGKKLNVLARTSRAGQGELFA